ncbi:MAG: winged helix-turn-helix domain-containing protein [Desulfarculus sp.]|nr:winged helix-turn-helix domain-containing protein [Desulfarculus sp.]
MKKPILVLIEDESDIQEVVTFNFQKADFAVHKAGDGEEGLRLVRRLNPDLVLLDLLLPDMDGREVCRQLKRDNATRSIPIVMLTALAGEADRIVGFELGADDYLTKPFSPRELVLRAQAILRRAKEPPLENQVLRVGRLMIDPDRLHVELDGQAIQLTSTEFRLLHYLAGTPGKIHSREYLLDLVWGYSYKGYSRTVDTHIRRLRAKLGSAQDYIETVRGAGYRVREGL